MYFAEKSGHRGEIGERVAFGQPRENRIVHRLGGAGHKKASGIAKGSKVFGVAQQVLDLDGHVVGNFRKLLMKRRNDLERVPRTVEKIRIAKSDVLGARGHLLADVGEDNFLLHDSELAVINRNDRAVTAKVLAPAAGFRVAGHALFAAGQDQMRVMLELRQAGTPQRPVPSVFAHRSGCGGLSEKI